jgi:hypothetical protein
VSGIAPSLVCEKQFDEPSITDPVPVNEFSVQLPALKQQQENSIDIPEFKSTK